MQGLADAYFNLSEVPHPVARIFLRVYNCHPKLPLLCEGHLVSFVYHFFDLIEFDKQFCLILH